MIAVDELLKQIRRTLKDEDKNSYSDDELLSYIQSGIVFVRRIIIQLNPEYLSVPLAEGTLEPGNNKITVDKSTSYIYDVRIDGKRIKPAAYRRRLWEILPRSRLRHPRSVRGHLGRPSCKGRTYQHLTGLHQKYSRRKSCQASLPD